MHRTTLNMSEKTHQTNLNCDNVSQQIQVGNQEFKCIINLNTTVCANKSKHRRACRRKHRPRHTEGHTKQRAHKHNKAQRLKVAPRKKVEYSWKWGPRYNDEYRSDHGIPNPSAKERIAPNCYRTACWDRHECRKENDRRKNIQMGRNTHEERDKRSSSIDEAKHEHKPSKHHHHHHRKYGDLRQEIKQTSSRILLSPISSSPLPEYMDNLTYEDISMTSFEIHVEKKLPPPVYKRYRKPRRRNHMRQHKHKREMQESKLDTLIRRTKERERKLVEQSRRDHAPWFTSTPVRNEYSSADFPMSSSDMDISFSSLSTFVLGHKAYSPSCPIEDLQTPIEDLEIPTEDFSPVSSPVGDYQSSKIEGLICGGYSPSSPTKDYTPKVPETVYKVLNVKNEPTMDIEAYSPTSTPKINYQDIEIKREIVFKSEPLFSCEISPIYFENENDKTGLEFCKIESVKGESIDDYVD